ncbi:hypothetical protein AJ80_05511 [Polytolypa hystricis UAMH7299]|uniref:F-box domain-containing protein n=1 Tax=Polytolypa hystricis (strain UAMH7299) TaxID=1447883 RepID=A0A2B7XUQ0_POLH7|nr:hypothetical protein AJ80_05511 [Polytolypa hystricis UAMH7299]
MTHMDTMVPGTRRLIRARGKLRGWPRCDGMTISKSAYAPKKVQTMAHLTYLPLEILFCIVGYLSSHDPLSMLRCSKKLHHALEPVLYKRLDALNNAMYWACGTGNLATIRVAVSHGASVSTAYKIRRIAGPSRSPRAQNTRPKRAEKTSTLYLAAMKRRLDAFNLLIELGARLDDPSVPKGVANSLICWVSHPHQNWSHLPAFIGAGFHEQVRARNGGKLGLDVALMILNCEDFPASPLDLIQQLFDDSESLNRVYRPFETYSSMSPLSAAIWTNSRVWFEVLIARGANIHGLPLASMASRVPLEIPVFAAAYTMLKHRSTDMLQLCLDHGADINHHLPAIDIMFTYKFYTTMPLLSYLDTIDDGDDLVAEQLTYLFDHGALDRSNEAIVSGS